MKSKRKLCHYFNVYKTTSIADLDKIYYSVYSNKRLKICDLELDSIGSVVLMKNSKKTIKKSKYNLIAWWIVFIGALTILSPLLLYRENYIFTVHDYLDSWPPLFEVLRRSGLFFSPDSSMPIMGGMSTCYLYFDFGIYRLLNFLFGSIYGEIVNKIIGIVLGFCFSRRFFSVILDVIVARQVSRNSKADLSSIEWLSVLLAGGYAFSAVYPNWTISFAFLPLYLEMLFKMIYEKDKFNIRRTVLSLFFGFFVYFPCIGIFVFGLYFIVFIFDVVRNKKIKKNFFLYLVLMFVGIVLTNINVFIYLLRGDELNRSLIPLDFPANFHDGLGVFVKMTGKVGLFGQYHAAPVLYLLMPICIIGYFILFFQLIKKRELKRIMLPTGIVGIIIVLCIIYTLNEINVLRYVMSKIIPFLSGFNLGRIVYFNNILWYILAIIIFMSLDKSELVYFILFIVMAMNIGVVIISPGAYRETAANILHGKSIENGKVTFAQFYDTEYFDSLKEDIEYNNEGIISVGYHPAVAMFNGFNTIDGYMSTNPLEYHYSFREIIAPTLDRYPAVAKSYDTWGGRLYCYTDDSKNVEPSVVTDEETRELLIDVQAFYNKGGRYIFSKYELENAEELRLSLVEHKKDMESSIYQVWIYEIGGEQQNL